MIPIPKEDIEATIKALRESGERAKSDPEFARQVLADLFKPSPFPPARPPKELYEELMEELKNARLARELRE